MNRNGRDKNDWIQHFIDFNPSFFLEKEMRVSSSLSMLLCSSLRKKRRAREKDWQIELEGKRKEG